MKNILEVASMELGVHEIRGNTHEKRILEYARESGFQWVKDDETPWCSIFMNWVAKESGFERSNSAAARSWLNVGTPISNPEPGDIVIFWRESIHSHLGHVGVFLGYSKDGSRVYVLGGNQGDSVSISAYGKDQILGFRRLRATNNSNSVVVPQVKLKKGDKGLHVSHLQDALKAAGFNPGTTDGDFGPRTEKAVKDLQSRNSSLTISGKFDEETRDYLESLLTIKENQHVSA